ncbi:MAG: phosphatase PAP2 family protein [Acidobacteriota bacterium]|nr:phosphatase PAP2 family protein [Acidobacteriota bacterium]
MGVRLAVRSRGRIAAWGLLAAVFLANYVETTVEDRLRETPVSELGYRTARAFTEVESTVQPEDLFANHEATGAVAVYGYSVAYFFLFPIVALGLALALTCHREEWPLRVFARALAIDYAVSLPFFLLFPVPERWAYPESGAILLSDRWSAALIAALRPMSGLDNCFPSFHVSMSVVLVAVAFLAGVRFRGSIAALGLAVVISTFGLGIHWLPDIVAGVATGILSVALALRFEAAGRSRKDLSRWARPAGVTGAPFSARG